MKIKNNLSIHIANCSIPALFVLALVVTPGSYQLNSHYVDFGQDAIAAGEHSGGGHSSGGHSSGGHSSGGHEDEGDADHGSGHSGKKGGSAHQGGHGNESGITHGNSVESKVLRGKRPVWAQEGIPEVELGRLNISRAPGHVLSRAEAEALSTYSAQMAAFYNLTADQAAQLLEVSYRDVARYDSPLQNLALYKDIMTYGQSSLTALQPASQLDLAAIFLGSASDKNLPVSEDTVIAVNRILGLMELSPADRATLASKAEQVRAAILAGHGDTDH